MYPWIIILFAAAGIVFVIDFLFRRKKWNDNSKEEKTSLILNMFSVGPYVFLSVLGALWGIVPGSPESAFGKMIYEATLTMGSVYFIIAAAAVVLSLIFRKKGKTKASIGINIFAFAYIAVVLAVNSFAGKLL